MRIGRWPGVIASTRPTCSSPNEQARRSSRPALSSKELTSSSRVLVVDPSALDLEASLVMALLDSVPLQQPPTSTPTFAMVYEEDLGASPPRPIRPLRAQA